MLAYQRYGRGKALAMPIQDSWLWRMDAKMAVEDTTHATFWRRLVRWLVDGVPDPVECDDHARPRGAGRGGEASAEVARFGLHRRQRQPRRRARDVSVGEDDAISRWSGPSTRDGEYRPASCPTSPGLYAINVEPRGRRDQKTLGTGSIHVRASAGDAEYFDASMRAPLLKRIAEETGGRFFTPANAATLPEAISYTGRGVTVVEERDLWDMPAPAPAARPDGHGVGLPPRAGSGMTTSRLGSVRGQADVRLRPRAWRCLRALPPFRVRTARPAAQDTHLLVITGVGGRRRAREPVSPVGDGDHRRRERTRRADRRQHHLPRRQARSRAGAHQGTLDAGQRAEGVCRPRGARAGRRPGVHHPDWTRQFRRQGRRLQSAGPGSVRRGLRRAAVQAARAAHRLREHGQFERRFPGAAGRAGPHHRHGDANRRRAQRNAVRAVFRGGVQGHRRRHGSQRPRVGERSVRVREDQGRRHLSQKAATFRPSTPRSTTAREGKFAGTLFLESDRAKAAATAKIADPELRALLDAQRDLENEVAALRLRKDAHGPGGVRAGKREAADRAGAQDARDSGARETRNDAAPALRHGVGRRGPACAAGTAFAQRFFSDGAGYDPPTPTRPTTASSRSRGSGTRPARAATTTAALPAGRTATRAASATS